MRMVMERGMLRRGVNGSGKWNMEGGIWMEKNGYTVLSFRNEEVLTDRDSVRERILEEAGGCGKQMLENL